MRLIDADKIEFVLPRTLTEEEKNTYNLVIGKAFDNAPTVEAIPIEFIEKYLEKWKHAETYDIVHSWWLIIKRDWEKEHEKDI